MYPFLISMLTTKHIHMLLPVTINLRWACLHALSFVHDCIHFFCTTLTFLIVSEGLQSKLSCTVFVSVCLLLFSYRLSSNFQFFRQPSSSCWCSFLELCNHCITSLLLRRSKLKPRILHFSTSAISWPRWRRAMFISSCSLTIRKLACFSCRKMFLTLNFFSIFSILSTVSTFAADVEVALAGRAANAKLLFLCRKSISFSRFFAKHFYLRTLWLYAPVFYIDSKLVLVWQADTTRMCILLFLYISRMACKLHLHKLRTGYGSDKLSIAFWPALFQSSQSWLLSIFYSRPAPSSQRWVILISEAFYSTLSEWAKFDVFLYSKFQTCSTRAILVAFHQSQQCLMLLPVMLNKLPKPSRYLLSSHWLASFYYSCKLQSYIHCAPSFYLRVRQR